VATIVIIFLNMVKERHRQWWDGNFRWWNVRHRLWNAVLARSGWI